MKTEEEAYILGRAYATLVLRELDEPSLRIAVGGDKEATSQTAKEALIKGMTETGLAVLDLGLVSTPTFYYTVAANRYHGGVMVTGRLMTDCKIVRKEAELMTAESGWDELHEIMQKNLFAPEVAEAQIASVSHLPNIVDTQMMQQGAIALSEHGLRPMKIIIDTGNGMGGPELQELFKRVQKVQVTWLDTANTDTVQKMVPDEKADFGIAVDSDGDQLVFFDERGNSVAHEVIAECIKKFEPIYAGAFLGHHLFKFEHGTFESPVLLVIRFIQYISSTKGPVSALPIGLQIPDAPRVSPVPTPFSVINKTPYRFHAVWTKRSPLDYVWYLAIALFAIFVVFASNRFSM